MEAEKTHIIIKGCGTISPLGHNEATTANSYLKGEPAFSIIQHANQPTSVAVLTREAEESLQKLIASDANYKNLDRSVLMAVYTTLQAAEQAGWLTVAQSTRHDLAVNIGSSRGATGLFEQHHTAYQANDCVAPAASPTTTLGNVSSWAAHAVNAGGAQISHSMTCSTALMAIANGVAWLQAGMAKRFLAGGTEAPLTPFTLAQLKAIGIYSKLINSPCRPYSTQKQNTFVLGEGAAVLALERIPSHALKPGDVIVEAVGFGFEPINSKTGISENGLNFQQAMQHALSQLPTNDSTVDLIITHTPGTIAGDRAELAAIRSVFGTNAPLLTTNKWLMGHTLGASGALSIAYALHILKHQKFAPIPYSTVILNKSTPHLLKRTMINAAGFGGNAACVILKRF